ncbi:MAG TPA: VTT domain-containing protein [Acidimicrobiales bacterium]|nr:VTT domain-containing protein [Acidimicrobiales bacterium]
MKRYGWAMAAIVLALVVGFVVVEAAGVPVLTEPDAAMTGGGFAAALVGVGLLVGDVVLPVPSSVVMLTHGALFGVVVGALLSLVGTVGAAVAGVCIGRGGERVLGVPAAGRRRAHELLDRWGVLAVVATRPVPVLAEATAIMAGAAGASPLRVGVAAAAGGLPAALLYALAGSLVVNTVSGAAVFVAVLALAAAFWLVSMRQRTAPRLGGTP